MKRNSWNDLLTLTQGKEFEIEKVRIIGSGTALEGRFEVPRIANLEPDDLRFVESFVRSHGSIKSMEKEFEMSYPTVKNRLNSLASKLTPPEEKSKMSIRETLQSLIDGEIDLDRALAELEQ